MTSFSLGEEVIFTHEHDLMAAGTIARVIETGSPRLRVAFLEKAVKINGREISQGVGRIATPFGYWWVPPNKLAHYIQSTVVEPDESIYNDLI